MSDTQEEYEDDGDLNDADLKEIEDKAIASGDTTKEKIDAAEQAQEASTAELVKHVFEYQRYTDLSQVVRHLLGSLVQLNKYKDKRRVDYWAKVTRHWEKQVAMVIDNKELYNPPLTKQLLDELDTNIERLRSLKAHDLNDVGVIVDDIKYRLGAMYGSLVSLEGIKQYAIEKRHSDLVEYIQRRIKILEDGQLNPTALDTMESLTNNKAVIIELRGLIYQDTQPKTNVE